MLAMIKNLRQRPDYLPHVDGLRAVAVLGVFFIISIFPGLAAALLGSMYFL